MSDLTRRVLAWDAADPDEYECFDPMPAMADAATILARQVEAVEALADELEDQGHRGLDSAALANVTAGIAAIAAAARIRGALNVTD